MSCNCHDMYTCRLRCNASMSVMYTCQLSTCVPKSNICAYVCFQIEGLSGSQTPSNNDLPIIGASAPMFRSKGFWKQAGLLILALDADKTVTTTPRTTATCMRQHQIGV